MFFRPIIAGLSEPRGPLWGNLLNGRISVQVSDFSRVPSEPALCAVFLVRLLTPRKIMVHDVKNR